MCLIIHGKSALIRSTLLNTPHLIDEIFTQNGDGLGIMYNSSRGVRVYKWLPNTLAEARTAVAMFPQDDRELAVHWRWRTHGEINKENCHPYPVDGGGHLIHNGVLATGNAADTTRSDTYHYIKQFLSGGVMEKVGHEPAFLKMLTAHIGSGNKFVLMTSDGRMSIAGRHRGIDLGGLWWSNTYAWDPRTLDPTWVDPDEKPMYALGSYVGSKGTYGGWQSAKNFTGADWYDDQDDEDLATGIWSELLTSCDTDGIVEVLKDEPYLELRGLFELGWGMEPYSNSQLDAKHQELLDLVLDQKTGRLAAECRNGNLEQVADVLAYYVAWTLPDPRNTEPVAPTVSDSPNAVYAG